MIILYTFLSLYALWLSYVLTMHIIHKWDTLPMASKVLGFPAAAFAYLFDIFLNWTVCTVIFLDWPQEKTITERLHRYRRGWRGAVARWVCNHLLNPFDPKHC